MATWTVTSQLVGGGTLVVGSTDRIWLNGTNFGDNVTVNAYQASTHISNSSDVHQCTSAHVNNTQWVTGSTVALNGAAPASVSSITTAQCPLLFNFQDAASVATSAGKFYAYNDAIGDSSAMVGITFQAFEQGNSAWTAANGSGAALDLAAQGANTTHNFYIALSATPTSTGAKTGKIKITLTYI